MSLADSVFQDYYQAVFDTNRELALSVVEDGLERGLTPEDIVFRVVVPAIDKMIKDLTVTRTASLSQHFVASKVAEEVTDRMFARFAGETKEEGCIVIGAAKGDFHGLGKKIVGGYLKAHLFTVHDIGLNASAEEFVDAAVENDAQIIGVSSMMMHTATHEDGPLGVRRILKERGLESRIKLIVGGAPYRFDHGLYMTVQADAWAEDGVKAVPAIKGLIAGMANG